MHDVCRTHEKAYPALAVQMAVQRKNRISGQKRKQQNGIEKRNMVGNINAFFGQMFFIKVDMASDLKAPEKKSQAETYEVLQDINLRN